MACRHSTPPVHPVGAVGQVIPPSTHRHNTPLAAIVAGCAHLVTSAGQAADDGHVASLIHCIAHIHGNGAHLGGMSRQQSTRVSSRGGHGVPCLLEAAAGAAAVAAPMADTLALGSTVCRRHAAHWGAIECTMRRAGEPIDAPCGALGGQLLHAAVARCRCREGALPPQSRRGRQWGIPPQ